MIFGLTYAFFTSQILAGIAIVSDIFSFQFKERKKIILFFIVSAFCIALHYLLLERYAAFVLVTLGIARFFTAYYSTQKVWMYGYILSFIIATYILAKDYIDIIVLVATLLVTYAVFQTEDKKLRLAMMMGTSLVILYNFLIFSPIGVLLESIFLGSNIVGYYRHYLTKRTIGIK